MRAQVGVSTDNRRLRNRNHRGRERGRAQRSRKTNDDGQKRERPESRTTGDENVGQGDAKRERRDVRHDKGPIQGHGFFRGTTGGPMKRTNSRIWRDGTPCWSISIASGACPIRRASVGGFLAVSSRQWTRIGRGELALAQWRLQH